MNTLQFRNPELDGAVRITSPGSEAAYRDLFYPTHSIADFFVGGFPSERERTAGPVSGRAGAAPKVGSSEVSETLRVLRRLIGMGRSRTPQTARHQTECGDNQGQTSIGAAVVGEGRFGG